MNAFTMGCKIFNPCFSQLVPAYKGFTIDSLRKLDFLDGITLTADDKHKYKGLAKRKGSTHKHARQNYAVKCVVESGRILTSFWVFCAENVIDEAKVTLRVEYVRGIPMPEEMEVCSGCFQ